MIQRVFFITIVLISVLSCTSLKTIDKPPTQIILVRHAEKRSGNDPMLTPAGKDRAQALSEISEMFPISGVYSSNYKRALSTAQPLASKLGVTINKSIFPTHYSELLQDIESKHVGKAVLVVGHSNTIPAFVNHVLGQKKLSMIDEKDFSNLYVITINAGSPSLAKFTYEAADNLKIQLRKK